MGAQGELIRYRGVEGAGVLTLDPDARLLVEVVERPGPAVDESAVASRWAALRAGNPRYFDGPVLSVLSIGRDERPDRGAWTRIACRRGRYSHLAAQNPGAGFVETYTDQLSVTAVVTGRDAAGREHVLLGRRGESTRIYGGMWELGPSGGVDAPAAGVSTLEEHELAKQVRSEVEEELGGSVRVDVGETPCMTYDAVARSWDVVARCRAIGPVRAGAAAAGNWEYGRSEWVPVDAVGAFDALHAGSIIAPTRALLRFFRWA